MKSNYLSILFFLLFLISASAHGQNSKSKGVELIKQLAYCKCLDYGVSKFVGKDTIDISTNLIADQMPFYGPKFVAEFYSLLDNKAKQVIDLQEKWRFDNQKHESAIGKVTYKLACLDFYKSKSIDSLAKFIYKKTGVLK